MMKKLEDILTRNQIKETIEFIKEYSKYRTPTLKPGKPVCAGVDCEECELEETCKTGCHVLSINDYETLKSVFPEYFI